MIHKLQKKVFIKGEITAETGLMIGGASSSFEIGGLDKTIVRHPASKLPYIPGSSLKGKMRSLLEQHLGTIDISKPDVDGRIFYGPTLNSSHIAAQIFGYIKSKATNVPDENKGQRPSRIIVRDGELKNPKEIIGTELPCAEIKAENSIDRITSEANPRFFERVPKGGRFALDLILNVFEENEGRTHFMYIMKSLMLLQDDYLGAAGSRGNGQISIKLEDVMERCYEDYTEETPMDECMVVKKSSYNNMLPSIFKNK